MKLKGKPVDLAQLEAELRAAGVPVDGLGVADDDLHTYGSRTASRVELVPAPADAPADADATREVVIEYEETGVPVPIPDEHRAAVEAALAAHRPLREKTDGEYAAEWKDATAQRQRDILAIKAGLLPRERVPFPAPDGGDGRAAR